MKNVNQYKFRDLKSQQVVSPCCLCTGIKSHERFKDLHDAAGSGIKEGFPGLFIQYEMLDLNADLLMI